MRKIKLGVLGILVVLFALSIFTILRTPPTNKNWNDEGLVLSQIKMSTSSVEIENIKNFSYQNTDHEYVTGYYKKTFPLDQVKNIYFLVNPFWGYQFAHTFLTFEFENGDNFFSVLGVFIDFKLLTNLC
jgi:hypothetical protein